MGIKSFIGLPKAKLIELPKIFDHRGNLTFIESKNHIPFEIKRVYYVYDVPGGAARGGHAHKNQEEFIIAANGSFDVILDDGNNKKRVHLNRSYYGLYVPKMIWRELDNFSSGCVCLVMASDVFDEKDYIRDYNTFIDQIISDENKINVSRVPRINGRSIVLRPVEVEDAQYILDIRTARSMSKYITKTENSIDKQVQWIKDYKIREEAKKDFYYIIESIDCKKFGTIRLYDIKADSFSWGSWVIERGSPPNMSIESVLLIYEQGFYVHGFDKCHFEVRKVNQKLIDFHLKFGARKVGEDELTCYFQIDRASYEKSRAKYSKYLLD